LLLVLASGVALAASPGRSPVELSMLLTGTVVIAPDGRVQSYTLDQAEKLSPTITAFMDKSVSAWTFRPVEVDGKPVTAKSKMNVRLVADPGEGDQFVVRVKGASFGENKPGETISYVKGPRRVPPHYPPGAVHARAGGTVYLLVKVNRDGTVLDAAAEQVNLTERGPAPTMKLLRKMFADASVNAARHWTFDVPTIGPHAGEPWWVARVPVSYWITNGSRANPATHYGQWQAYVPGPVEIVPWADTKLLANDAIDTVPDDAVQLLAPAPRLQSGGIPHS
jgi:hypothetical protein